MRGGSASRFFLSRSSELGFMRYVCSFKGILVEKTFVVVLLYRFWNVPEFPGSLSVRERKLSSHGVATVVSSRRWSAHVKRGEWAKTCPKKMHTGSSKSVERLERMFCGTAEQRSDITMKLDRAL